VPMPEPYIPDRTVFSPGFVVFAQFSDRL